MYAIILLKPSMYFMNSHCSSLNIKCYPAFSVLRHLLFPHFTSLNENDVPSLLQDSAHMAGVITCLWANLVATPGCMKEQHDTWFGRKSRRQLWRCLLRYKLLLQCSWWQRGQFCIEKWDVGDSVEKWFRRLSPWHVKGVYQFILLRFFFLSVHQGDIWLKFV
jgi:hypothetical protein